MESYESVRQGSLVDIVYNTIKKDILNRKINPGDRLPTQEVLAKQFGVSRTVIREAQKKLASLGMVENRQGSGTFVCRIRAEDVMGPILSLVELDAESTAELLETRFYLERVIVRLAAERVHRGQVKHLDSLIDDMNTAAKAKILDEFNQADVAFHMELAKISGNRAMSRVLETIRDMTYRFLMAFSRSDGAMDRAIRFHRAIARAVEAKDPDLAEKQMLLHLIDIMENVKIHFNLPLEIPEINSSDSVK